MKMFGNKIRYAIQALKEPEDRHDTPPDPADLIGPWFLVELVHLSVLVALVAALNHFFVTPIIKKVNVILNFGNDPSPYVVGFFWGVVGYYTFEHWGRQIARLWRERVMPTNLETKIAKAISPYFGHKIGWAIRAWKGQ